MDKKKLLGALDTSVNVPDVENVSKNVDMGQRTQGGRDEYRV